MSYQAFIIATAAILLALLALGFAPGIIARALERRGEKRRRRHHRH